MYLSLYEFAEKIRPLGFKNEDEYQSWWINLTPDNKIGLVYDYNQEYRDQWIKHQKIHNDPYTLSGFLLGTFSLSHEAKRKKLLPFEQQRDYVRQMVSDFEKKHNRNFLTKDYLLWSKTERPDFISSKPERLPEFINWPDWWGHKSCTYDELKIKISELSFKIKDGKEYNSLVKNGTLQNFPLNPQTTFINNGWEGWPIFLGNTSRIRRNKTNFKTLEDHIIYAKSLSLPNEKAWRAHCKTSEFLQVSHLYSSAPHLHFVDFPGYGDKFFGNGQVYKNHIGINHYDYREAVEKLKSYSFSNINEYQSALKDGVLDKTKFPMHPVSYYKNKGYVSSAHYLSYVPKQWQKNDIINILNDIKAKHRENLDSFSMMVLMQYLNIPTQKLLNVKGEDRKLGDLILGLTDKKTDETENKVEIEDIVHAIENSEEETFQQEETDEDFLSQHIEQNEEDQEEQLEFLSANNLKIIEGLIEEVMADDYAVFSLINNSLGKIWREFFVHQDINLIRNKNNNGEFNSVILNKFFEEYNLTTNHTTPKDFNTGCGINPNIMQIFTCCKLAHQKRLFNFSGTGAGKTLSSIYSAIHNNNKFVVIITENNVTSQWEKEILKFDLNANILDKKLLINNDKRNYLVINFEQFQLPRTRKLIDNLIKLAPDFIILDEIQNVKVRGSENSIRRTNIEFFLTTLSNNNHDLFLLAMSATPCVNNLNEIKSLLELGLNESLKKIKTSPTVMNAFYLHSYVVNYGIRYMPKYPILADYKYPDIDASDSHDIIVRAHKEKNPLFKEQILLGFKLPSLMSFLKPGTIIYTEYVDGIALEAKNYIEANSDFKVGLYTGNQSEEEKAETLAKFKRCHGKTKNKYDILIGSSTIGTGVDGLQEVCDNLIFLTLPWTSAAKQQVDGRVIRQNSKFEKVQIITPQVVYHAIVDGQEKTWSYDYYRQNIINNKKTLMDCVMDGVNPSHLDPNSKQQDLIKAHQGLNKWIEHLLENDMTTHSQTELKITNITLVNEQPIKLKSDWAKLNTSWKKKHSANLHDELNKNNEEWQEYHSLYAEKRLQWAEIPAEVIAKKLISRQEWKIADLGSGECLLRNNLPNHKITEYDHISFDEKVISCDISNLPVENNTFDAAVLSLALMGANWSDYVKESYRILKDFGLLIIAENERSWENFENNEIIDCLQEYGFNIKSKEISQGFIYIQAIK
jgi:superfamily II DNA or RNA helicase